MIRIFPTLIVPTLIYALFAVASWDTMPQSMATVAFVAPMPAGSFSMTWGQILLTLATMMLFIEILKSSAPSRLQMLDNGLSVGVFIVCFVLFLLVRPFTTGEFFIITLMALLDFLAAAVIMTRVAQRTVQYDH